MNTGRVYFALLGDRLDPEAVTRFLGVSPTKIRHKGLPIPKVTSWELSTPEIKSEVIDVYGMSEQVVGQLIGKEAEILQIVEAYAAEVVLEVVLVISPNERVSTPAIGFSQRVVRFVADVGGFIDVDTYRGES